MRKEPDKNTERPVFFRKWDLAVLAVLLVAALGWLLVSSARAPGAVALVSIGRGDGQTQQRIALSQDAVHHLEGTLPVTLEVEDGAIRFVHSVCPDHLCEGYGWLRQEGDWAACLPAQVVVRVVDAQEDAAS